MDLGTRICTYKLIHASDTYIEYLNGRSDTHTFINSIICGANFPLRYIRLWAFEAQCNNNKDKEKLNVRFGI